MKRFPKLFFLAVFLFGSHALFYAKHLGWEAVDDAYISFRYGHNLVSGFGLVYNMGERVEGFSNFLWTVISAGVIGARLPIGQGMMTLGTLFSVGTIWLTWSFVYEKTKKLGLALLAAGLLAVDGSFALWSVSGMETAMFTFLVFLGAVLFVRYRTERKVYLAVMIFFLASLTRLEGVIFFAITLGWWLGWSILVDRTIPKRWLFCLIAFIGLFGPYFWWRYSYYGYFFPNSFYAKVNFSNPLLPVWRGVGYLGNFFIGHLGVITIPVIGYLFTKSFKDFKLKKRQELFWQGYFVALILVCFSYVTAVGGDWSIGRFFVPVLPRMYILLALGMGLLAERFFDKNFWNKPISFLAMGLIAIVLWFSSSYQGEYWGFVKRENAGEIARERIEVGKWLKKNVPPGTVIAVDAAGVIPFYSELPTIDMFGMNDQHIAHLDNPNLGLGVAGHEKFDLGYVLSRRPQYLVITGKGFGFLDQYTVLMAGQYLNVFSRTSKRESF